MNTYELLEEEALSNDINIVNCDFKSPNIKGLYCNSTVGMSNSLETSTEKACILAEELGHHHTSIGNILNQSVDCNRKQERQARLWAYNNCIGLRGLIRAYKHGCQDFHDTAKFLEVTEEFLEDCVDCYRDKYGTGVAVDDYYLMFIPYFTVGRII